MTLNQSEIPRLHEALAAISEEEYNGMQVRAASYGCEFLVILATLPSRPLYCFECSSQ